MDFSDNTKGFYNMARDIFDTLASEEIHAAEWANEDVFYYPDFGNSKSGYDDFVKPFYASWINFRTQKTFSWMDLYRYQDAPDRRVKRLMEKENKKARESAIREFNDTVRVCFPNCQTKLMISNLYYLFENEIHAIRPIFKQKKNETKQQKRLQKINLLEIVLLMLQSWQNIVKQIGRKQMNHL